MKGDKGVERFEFSKAKLLATEPPEKGSRCVYDRRIPKLACRISAAGSRAYYVVTWAKGRMEWVKVANLDEVSVDQARKQAAKIIGQFAEGKNPAQVRREERAEMSLGDAFDSYITELEARKVKSVADLRQLWERCLGKLPDEPRKRHARERTKHPGGVNWENRRLSQVSEEEVKKLHYSLGRTTQIQANRAVELLRTIYNHVRVAPNPASNIKPYHEHKRDRFLRDDELPRFFAALAEDSSEAFRDFTMLALLSGARRGNVLAMKWADIDFSRAAWRVAHSESKNAETMEIVLIPEAIAILERRKQQAAKQRASKFVFPADSADGCMTPPKKRWRQLLDRTELRALTSRLAEAGQKFERREIESQERALVRARAAADAARVDRSGARLEDVRLHDLRRTLASHQAIGGASMLIISKTLGHANPNGATFIYSRLSSDPVRASVEAATSRILTAGGLKSTAKIEKLKGRKAKARA